MSMNLRLRVRLFGEDVTIGLRQAPSTVTRAALGNPTKEAKFEAYASWLRGWLCNEDDATEVEDHLRQVAFFNDHALAKWSEA